MSGTSSPPSGPDAADAAPSRRALIVFSWLWVGAPLVYGVFELVKKATQLFTG